MTLRDSPVLAVAELVIRLAPGALVEKAIATVGHQDKPLLVIGVLVVTGLLFAWAGRLRSRSWWQPLLVYAGLAAVGSYAVADQRGAGFVDQVPVVVGLLTWAGLLEVLTAPLRAGAPSEEATAPGVRAPDGSRRGFLLGGLLVAGVSVAVGLAGRVVGQGRRQVEQTRRLLRLADVSAPVVPRRATLDLDGLSPWETPADDFYLVHTAIVVPAIAPDDWTLRLHGMVDRELELSYRDLLARQHTEDWITLNCVSNPVGGPLIGNAWWSGIRLADLLREAGVHADADAVLQTSQDGWTCGTPLAALTDDRPAMLALAMNGRPLPIDHGFPVRTIVPGLYGYVSACKWVVDLEVTQFSRISAYWTQRGWSERGPVKLSSRIDVPREGAEVAAGTVRMGGVAWAQHVGIESVEVAVDGGGWQRAEISHPPTTDAWVQWVASARLDPGEHRVKVRCTDRHGLVQTGVERDVLPDGATGWHTVGFTVTGS
nr:molybdopterin-dependent oxidoreductase [Nocardioides panaciterrulae]